jgi:hypothetical protein
MLELLSKIDPTLLVGGLIALVGGGGFLLRGALKAFVVRRHQKKTYEKFGRAAAEHLRQLKKQEEDRIKSLQDGEKDRIRQITVEGERREQSIPQQNPRKVIQDLIQANKDLERDLTK